MKRLEVCSYILSVVAIVMLVALLCCNAGWLPESNQLILRIAAVATSAIAGLFGLVAMLVLDYHKQTRAAWIVAGWAFFAGIPALAMLMHVVFPND